MTNMRFLNYKLCLLLLIISIICGLPHLFGFYYQGNNYSLLSPSTSLTSYEEMYFYATRTKQILRGDLIPHDAHIFEYQNAQSPYIGETLPSYVMALFALIFGSVEKGFIAADFILPSLTFLIIYFFVKSVTRNRYLSVLCPLGVIFVREIFIYFPYPAATIKYLFSPPSYVDNLVITRSFHPEVSMLFYILSLFLIYKAIFLSSKKNIVLAGLLLGLNFYNYIFYWTTIVFGLFIYFLLNTKSSETRKKIIAIICISFLVAVPYLFSLFRFSTSSFAHDFFIRSTSFRDQFPLQRAVRFIILSILIFILLIKHKKSKFIFLNSFIFAAALLPDLSLLVMKKDLEATHWIKMVVWPTAALFYPILIWEYLKKYTKIRLTPYFKKAIYIIISLSFIYYALQNQLLEGNSHTKRQRLDYADAQLFQELNKIPKKSVVAAIFDANRVSDNINLFIPAVSDNLIYVPYPTMTVASTDEIINRNLIMLSIFYTKEQIINGDINNIIINVYDWLNFNHLIKNKESFKKEITSKLDKINLYCKKYKIDYVLLEKGQNLKPNCFEMKKIFHNEKYTFYKIL